jgi:hypothetical protein
MPPHGWWSYEPRRDLHGGLRIRALYAWTDHTTHRGGVRSLRRPFRPLERPHIPAVCRVFNRSVNRSSRATSCHCGIPSRSQSGKVRAGRRLHVRSHLIGQQFSPPCPTLVRMAGATREMGGKWARDRSGYYLISSNLHPCENTHAPASLPSVGSPDALTVAVEMTFRPPSLGRPGARRDRRRSSCETSLGVKIECLRPTAPTWITPIADTHRPAGINSPPVLRPERAATARRSGR